MTEDEKAEQFVREARNQVPREFVVDFLEAAEDAAKMAKQVVWGGADEPARRINLSGRRANRATGLVRFQYLDEVFEATALRHRGELVSRIELELDGKERIDPVFLTTVRFGNALVGFASHREQDDLPVANQSRKALARLNAGLTRDLFRPGDQDFTESERFVVLMLQRDRYDVGRIARVSVAMVSADLQKYLFKEEVTEFLSGYGADLQPKPAVRLKKPDAGFRDAKKRGSQSDTGTDS
ncbi:MAG: hypothetical protein ACT6RL_10245 [Neoaquamicrobium sediminum]